MNQDKGFSYKELLVFSLPSILSSFLEPLSSLVDTALVGHINTTWLAALALGSTLFNSITWIFNFLVHIPTQNLSFFSSQKKFDKAGEVLRVGFSVAAVSGIIFSFVLYFLRFHLYGLVGANQETLSVLDEYFSVRVFGQAIVLVYLVGLSSLRGLSKVNESFYLVLGTTLINIVLSYSLIYQMDMGIAGAAWGTVIANTVGVIVSFAIIIKNQEVKSSLFRFEWPKEVAFNFGAHSINLFFRTFSLTACFFIATRFASEIGVNALATHQVALNFWLFSSYFIDGIAITANIKSAEYFGKKDFVSLLLVTKKLVHLSAFTGLIFLIAYATGKNMIWSLFTNDESVYLLLDTIWPWVAYSQVFASIAYLYDGILFGTTDYKFLRTHVFLGAVIFFLPLAYYGKSNGNLHGIWAGLTFLVLYRLVTGAYKIKSYGK